MLKIEFENRDFRKSLYFLIVDAEKNKKKRAASGRWHYIVDAEKIGCGCLSQSPDILYQQSKTSVDAMLGGLPPPRNFNFDELSLHRSFCNIKLSIGYITT